MKCLICELACEGNGEHGHDVEASVSASAAFAAGVYAATRSPEAMLAREGLCVLHKGCVSIALARMSVTRHPDPAGRPTFN